MCEKKNNTHHYCFYVLPEISKAYIYLICSSLKPDKTSIFPFQMLFWSVGRAFLVHFMISVLALRWVILPYYFFIIAFLTFGILLLLCWNSLQASLEDGFNHMPSRFSDGEKQKKMASRFPASSALHLLDKETSTWPFLCLHSCSTICLRAGQHMLCGRLIFRLPL